MPQRLAATKLLRAAAFLHLALLLALLPLNLSAATLASIQNDIDYVINTSNSNVQWSVLIENEWGTQVYYSKNPDTPRRPASNTKLFTTAGAMGLRGPTYVWRGYQLQSSSTSSPMEYVLSNSDNTLADELYGIAGGGSAVLGWCSDIGIDMTGAQMYDGSGLNYNNRFTARQTLILVRYMMDNYYYSQWATHLAIACTKGTLSSRMCATETTGRVHAKTGTLTNGQTLSLSGYVDNRYDGERYFFSIYCNGVPSTYQSDTRNRIDEIVKIMSRSANPNPGQYQPVIVDNSDAGFSASSNWWSSTSTAGYYGSNYKVRATGSVSDAASWSATLSQDGTYEVFVWYTAGSNRASAAPFIVDHAGGSTTVYVNQQTNNAKWVSLGQFQMYQGTAVRVRLSCWTSSGSYVIGDAVKFEKQ